jgi:alpha-mannosidase
VVESRDERPFLPVSWVDISDGEKGLAYFHQGSLKHWVTGNTLVNLFAWGEDTDAIGNRMDRVRWPKCFDQRLRGTHTIHAALYPHTGDWRSAQVVGAARSYRMPPSACATGRHAGKLPAALDVLRLEGCGQEATAVLVDEAASGGLVCRFYSYDTQPGPVTVSANRLHPVKVATLAGEPVEQIAPFQIGILTFRTDPDKYK